MSTSSIPLAMPPVGMNVGIPRPIQVQPAMDGSASSASPFDEEYSIGSYRSQVRTLAAGNSSPAQLFTALFKLLHGERGVVASSLRIRVGASTVSEFLANKNSVAPGKEAAFKKIHEDLLQSMQSDEALVKTQTLNGGTSLLASMAIPVPFASLEIGRGAIVLSLVAANRESVQGILNEFTDAINFAAAILVDSRTGSQSATQDRDLQAMGRTTDFRSSIHMAFALANNIAERFDCEQVGVGFVKSNRVEVAAVSGLSTFKANSPGIADLRQAMEECFDDKNVIVSQSMNAISEFHERPIHRQWSQNTRSAVCSIPLMITEEMVAVVSLRRTAISPFISEEIVKIQESVKPFASPIHLYRKSDRTLGQHFMQSAATLRHRLLCPKSKSGIAIRAVAIAALAFMLFGFIPYSPKCVGRIVPAKLTHLQAAFDMRLSQVLVQPGQSVKQGDVLVRFDQKELELERSNFVAEQARYEAEMRNFSDIGDISNASIAKAKAAVFKTKLLMTDDKLRKCEITAPYDGVVLEANLNRSIGQMFPQGDPILSIAPLNDFEIELRYPEFLVPHVIHAKSGTFSSLAQPGRRMDFELVSIDGTAVVEEGKNILRARAKLLSPHEGIRAGIDGVAYTDTGWKPVMWVAFHGIYDYLRYHFWI